MSPSPPPPPGGAPLAASRHPAHARYQICLSSMRPADHCQQSHSLSAANVDGAADVCVDGHCRQVWRIPAADRQTSRVDEVEVEPAQDYRELIL